MTEFGVEERGDGPSKSMLEDGGAGEEASESGEKSDVVTGTAWLASAGVGGTT